MTEREALLMCIHENFAELTPRRVYADWLEDHSECDRDVAQCEYIRDGSLKWLRTNWQRLVPSFMRAWCRPEMFPKDYRFNRVNESKREFRAMVVIPAAKRREWTAYLSFDTGFLVLVRWEYGWVASNCRESILDDQPFAANVYGPAAKTGDRHIPHWNRPWIKARREMEPAT